MKRMYLAAAAAALGFFGPGAQATTFDLTVSGAGVHWYANGVPGCDYSDPSGMCQAGYANTTWAGSVFVTTTSAADGTYSYGSGLQAITYVSNLDSFSYTAGDQPHWVYPQFGGDSYLAGLLPPAVVTIAGGQVSSIVASYRWDGSGNVTFNGLSITDFDGGQAGQPNADYVNVAGSLISVVPEPSALALLAAGAALLASRRVRKTRPNAGRCSSPPSST